MAGDAKSQICIPARRSIAVSLTAGICLCPALPTQDLHDGSDVELTDKSSDDSPFEARCAAYDVPPVEDDEVG